MIIKGDQQNDLRTYRFANRKDNMTDQTRWGIDLVQQENKARNYDKKNTVKLHEAQDIFKETNGLDNISEHTMKKFREIMLGGRQ
jgi:hypothetical protein